MQELEIIEGLEIIKELEVLISIRPNWIELIAQLIKTIEVRKTRPTLKPPFKCPIYCTQDKYKHLYDLRPYSNGDITLSVTTHNKHSLVPDNYLNGKVIGEFVCDKITRYNCDRDFGEYFVAGYVGAYMPLKEMCLTNKDLMEYGKGKPLYGWHISNPKIYDKPKELREFSRFGYITRGGVCVNSSCEYHHDNGYYEPPHCELYGSGNCSLERPPQSWCYVKEKGNDA